MRILRVVGSGLLPCGCFVGFYETYEGPTVQIVEERGVSCADGRHQPGRALAAPCFEPALAGAGASSSARPSIRSH